MHGNPVRGEQVSDRLRGGRVRVAGKESREKESFLRGLREFCAARGSCFEIAEGGEEIGPQEYVIVFGAPGRKPQEKGTDRSVPAWRREKAPDGMEGWLSFAGLMELLRGIGHARPRAAVLVSDDSVYGKIFGPGHQVKEDELGYVCHTDSRDQETQRLRTAEHLCSRMAREDKVNIKIVRLPSGDGTKEGFGAVAEAVLRVLLDGVPGEAYNVRDEAVPVPEEETSALSPIRVVMDTGKLRNLDQAAQTKDKRGEDRNGKE